MKALVVGVLALFAFSACSDNQSDAKVDFEVVADLTSRQTDARRFDRDGQATTGALVLDGKGRGANGDVGVVVWGLFNYRNTAGEFALSVEFDFGDGNTLYAYANAGRTTALVPPSSALSHSSTKSSEVVYPAGSMRCSGR